MPLSWREGTASTVRQGRHKILTLVNSFRQNPPHSVRHQSGRIPQLFLRCGGLDYVTANDIADLESKLDDTVCAVMLEYIQGEGGVNALEQAFVDAVFEKCAAKDVLVIADEVQTGVGRTGTFLAGEQFGHKADVTTLAKGIAGGLPMGACLANEKCAGVLGKGSHGSTFGGNPVCCAGGLAVLNTITADGFLAEVQRKAKLLREKLEKLDGVESVSGLGLMIGIALKDKKAIDVANAALEKGLLVLTAKTKVRLLPPLTITDEEIEKGVAILADVLSK
ncbi:MAG: aspartate aminotransferase family protein [Ruminococcus callidus]